jgi:excinuclease ABC subunit A
VIPYLQRRHTDAESEYTREQVESYMREVPCPECGGARLKPESLAVTIDGRNISELSSLAIRKAAVALLELKLSERDRMIAERVVKEINARLGFLLDVGLGYLSLDRNAGTLAGGEAQRIRLASQIGSALVGVLYVLDEPSIGLHQRDNKKLIDTLVRLRDLGNTVLVVEHDEETMRVADHIVDVGPGAGEHGGEVVHSGTYAALLKNKKSITGQYLSGKKTIPIPEMRRKPGDDWITIKGAREHNLQNIDVEIPLGCFVCVTGVSGSGKSTLINEILLKSLMQKIYKSKTAPGRCRARCSRFATDLNNTSLTSVDLPEPDTPVTHVSTPSGTRTSMFFRLCCLARRISSWPDGVRRFSGTGIDCAPDRY